MADCLAIDLETFEKIQTGVLFMKFSELDLSLRPSPRSLDGLKGS